MTFPRRGRVVAFALPVVSLVWTLLRLYRDPPVFAFDPFGGYFPGPIYDEALRPPAARCCCFRAGEPRVDRRPRVALALAAARTRPRPARAGAARALGVAAVPLLAGSLVLFAVGGAWAFTSRRADLAARPAIDAAHAITSSLHYARRQATRAPTWR